MGDVFYAAATAGIGNVNPDAVLEVK